jgi:hypothetical protein
LTECHSVWLDAHPASHDAWRACAACPPPFPIYCRNPQYPDVKSLQATVLCQQLARFASLDSRELIEQSKSNSGAASEPAVRSTPQLPASEGRKEASGGQKRKRVQDPRSPTPPQGMAGGLPVILGGDFNSLPAKYKADAFDKAIPRVFACVLLGSALNASPRVVVLVSVHVDRNTHAERQPWPALLLLTITTFSCTCAGYPSLAQRARLRRLHADRQRFVAPHPP